MESQEQVQNEFINWLKLHGKFENRMVDVIVNDNGIIGIKSQKATVMQTTPDDWFAFCKETNRNYESLMILFSRMKF